MKAAVLVFPGSNCDRGLAMAFQNAGFKVEMVWHKDAELPAGVDIVGVPGGFSFGDYLRSGAIAARSPIVGALMAHVRKGGHAIGICNGFQVLLETGLLPGALMCNAGIRFICKPVELEVATASCDFTKDYARGSTVIFPVAHRDGNYQATDEIRTALAAEDRIAFRYKSNINGSVDRIAGILSENRRVLGLMPHPERAADPVLGMTDGAVLFDACSAAAAAADA